MIKDFTPRLYQETILSTCALKNTLVVLPTGLGKTLVALLLAIQRLKQYPNSKILFLAPTRPLVEQHITTFQKHMNIEEEKLAIFTGNIPPKKRAEMWKKSQIFFSTPQGMENDIIGNKISLKDVSLIIFDEAHRAVGEYAYVFIAKKYEELATRPRILALTASPGADSEKIREVCENLNIEDIELRLDSDPDVKPYVQEMNIEWVNIDLPEDMKKIQGFLKDCFRSKLVEARNYGYLTKPPEMVSKTELLKLQGMLHSEISRGDKSIEILKSISLIAEAMKVQHALELLESQGIAPLIEYFKKLDSDARTTKVKAVQNLVRDINFKSAKILTQKLFDKSIDHPKQEELKRIITQEVFQNKNVKIIIFNQFRDTASKIVDTLSDIPEVIPKMFVGQAKKKTSGLSQKQQKAMIEEFKRGEFNCLVATSVAEEGLDIPSVDLVVFYEPVPSGIRTIQRRGRTGRQDKGRVIILMTKGTRDEGYKWSAHHKENRMRRALIEMKKNFALTYRPPKKKENTLEKFLKADDEIKIFVDYREKGSATMKEILEMGISLELQNLQVGDYILSNRCCVEYKKVPDFVASLVDGRMLGQLKSMKENYDRSIVIIEGNEDLYAQRRVHPNAIRGMMATIAVSYGIPMIMTKDAKESAAFIASIAKREQEENGKHFNAHGSKKPMGLKEQQEYIVSALPNIGPSVAKNLLEKFGSVIAVLNAPTSELTQVPLVGEKKAKDIQTVIATKYFK